MKRGLIDIGTNTAHLLIASVKEDRIDKVIYKERFYTFLGEGGLKSIRQEGIDRLAQALDSFEESLKHYNCHEIAVVATDALRNASNGPDLESHIRKRYGWPISVINGMEEAALIQLGVRQAVGSLQEDHLIMDIGGGSVEFIGLSGDERWFVASFPIGISRLYGRFHLTEPISESAIDELNEYLDSQLASLWNTIELHQKRPILIGCAGTFEIFLSSQTSEREEKVKEKIPRSKMKELLRQVRNQDLENRALVPDLPPERAKYIVVALLLIDYVLRRLDQDFFMVSTYALKEGVIVSKKYF